MKKLLLPVLVVIVMLASVSPAFAKGKPPTNPGQGAQKHSVTPAPKENGKPDKNVEKPNGKTKGEKAQNFVLFGKLGEVDLTAKTIKVTVDSGNNLVQGLLGQVVTITVPDGARIKTFEENRANWGSLTELAGATGGAEKEDATGVTVRVHGWWTPSTEIDTTPTEEATDTTVEPAAELTGTWTARQVYMMLDYEPEPFVTDTAPSGD